MCCLMVGIAGDEGGKDGQRTAVCSADKTDKTDKTDETDDGKRHGEREINTRVILLLCSRA